MVMSLMRRSVVSPRAVGRILSVGCSLSAAGILILGFRQLERMELNEGQLYSATLETLLLAAAFVGLAVLLTRRPRGA